jgi:hypothetical protein
MTIDTEAIRGWIARKLLNAACRVDPRTTIMCDARMGWHFQRRWKQPVMGGCSSTPNANLHRTKMAGDNVGDSE